MTGAESGWESDSGGSGQVKMEREKREEKDKGNLGRKAKPGHRKFWP